MADLRERFDIVLEALESDPDFVFDRAVRQDHLQKPQGHRKGVRQLIRARAIEFEEVELPGAKVVRVPTIEEALRIKSYLVVKRNQVRDHLDVAALANKTGVESAATVLSGIDEHYTDPKQDGEPVRSQITRQLRNPPPIGHQDKQRTLELQGAHATMARLEGCRRDGSVDCRTHG